MKRSSVATARLTALASVLCLLVTAQAHAEYYVNGFGATAQEAVAMARENGRLAIQSRGGHGCFGLKDGRFIKRAWKENGMYWVEIWMSKHDGSCGKKSHPIKIFGQTFDF